MDGPQAHYDIGHFQFYYYCQFYILGQTNPNAPNPGENLLEKEKRKENQRTREKKSPKSSIRLERLPRTALSVSTRMAMAFSLAQTILFSKTSLSIRTNGLRSFSFCLPFSSSSAASVSPDKLQSKKWRQPVASVLELGGVKIAKDGNLDHFPNTSCSQF